MQKKTPGVSKATHSSALVYLLLPAERYFHKPGMSLDIQLEIKVTGGEFTRGWD